MKKLILPFLGLFLAIGSFQAQAQKWTNLFDGKTFKGFKQLNGQAKYEVKDGVMVGTTVANTPNSFMATEQEYGDFILEFDVKVDNKMNSGVQFRSLSIPEYQNGRV
ncbi:MAG: 3-keto-disaccharide hydrolase, partial [Aquirufa sp.]